jgi:hypothetical protein
LSDKGAHLKVTAKWLQGFRERQMILRRRVSGETKDANHAAALAFSPTFASDVAHGEYHLSQVFNYDASFAEFWKPPTHILTQRNTRAAKKGYKDPKKNLGFAVAINVTGSCKVPILVVREFLPKTMKSVADLRGAEPSAYPVYEKNTGLLHTSRGEKVYFRVLGRGKKLIRSCDIVEWMRLCLAPVVRRLGDDIRHEAKRPYRALLLMDNANQHTELVKKKLVPLRDVRETTSFLVLIRLAL